MPVDQGPARNTFTWARGDLITQPLNVRQSADPMSDPIDVTGWTLSYKLKRLDSDAGASLVPVSVSIVFGINGTVHLVISASDCATLNGAYRGSLWRTDSGYETCYSRDDWDILDTTADVT